MFAEEKLDELQLLEKMYFGRWYVNEEVFLSLMSDMSVSSADSGSEASDAEQDNADNKTSNNNEPGFIPAEAALHSDLRQVTEPPPSLEGSDILRRAEHFDEDGNRVLDRSEWLEFVTSEGGKIIHAYKDFNDADVNHNGFIELDLPEEQERVEDIMKSTQ